MKFRFLLWMMGLLMGKASRTNPAFQQQLGDKDLVFQLQTLDGKVARHFVVKDQRITSKSGVVAEPAFAIAFKDAGYGFATMQANVVVESPEDYQQWLAQAATQKPSVAKNQAASNPTNTIFGNRSYLICSCVV